MSEPTSTPTIRDRIRELRRVRASELLPNSKNWRRHPDNQRNALRGVLTEIGYADALLAREVEGGRLMLLDGHLRAEVTPNTEVPVLVLDVTEAEADKILATLDPLAALAEADAKSLGELLKVVETHDAAVKKMLEELERDAGVAAGNGEVRDAEAQVDRAAELQKEWGTERGQVWAVEGKAGTHRLMCGDSTCKEDVERLMGGGIAEMMFADPPYGVDYEGGHFHSGDVNIKRARPKLEGDSDSEIYAKFLPVVLPHVNGPCYLWFAGTRGRRVFDAVEDTGGVISAMLVWHKVNATYAAMNAQYKQRHEPCLYFKPKGSTLRWVGPSDACTLWDFKKEGVNKLHPTQKPTELVMNALRNHKAATVLDPFLGSGTTIVAAENLGRLAMGMEIAPAYCAVTLQRLKDIGLSPRLTS